MRDLHRGIMSGGRGATVGRRASRVTQLLVALLSLQGLGCSCWAAGLGDQSLAGGARDDAVLEVSTKFGVITVQLQRATAPRAVDYVAGLVRNGTYAGCSLYRAEPPGPTLDDGEKERRDGYALVQGGAYSCGRQQSHAIPVEPGLPVRAGAVCLIGGTSEFFFSLGDHPEWDKSFTVFGTFDDIVSQKVLEMIVAQPTRQEKHPSGTVLRVLEDAVRFRARLRPAPTRLQG